MNIPSWPYYSDDEIKSACSVLSSGLVNYWTGTETKNFEKEFAKLISAKYAIALANGSLALSCAYLALNLKKGDEIITTPRTFIATSSSALLLGLKPVFADVDLNSGCITAETIEPLITEKTRAITVVHIAGWPADMEKISALANKYKLFIIEDCSQAHGAEIFINKRFQPVGSFGTIATWSFCQDKIISTGGEGGMITTNDLEIFEKIWSFKDHGKNLKKLDNNQFKSGFKWLHDNLGSNFRLTEFQSAIGRLQIKKLFSWNKLRTRNALILADKLNNIHALRIPLPSREVKHAWYKFNCFLNLSELKNEWSRNRIIDEINKKGYPAFHGGCSEIYLEKCFKEKGVSPQGRLKVAKELGETNLMFLVHPNISNKEMSKYAETIYSVIKNSIKS